MSTFMRLNSPCLLGESPMMVVGFLVKLGGALIKEIAIFRHKTQKFFFLAGSLSEFFW
jgi:hypothetical protein